MNHFFWNNTVRLVKLVSKPIVTIFMIYFVQRFWLFKNVFDNFDTKIANGSDAIYNLTLFLQNALNYYHGDFFGLNGDHFPWVEKTLGVTANNFLSGLITLPLFEITNNPFLIFNIIFYGNLFLIQFGIYCFLRYFKAAWIISVFCALLVPFSNAFLTFYTVHVHASYYWFLPYLLISIHYLLIKANWQKINSRLVGYILLFITCMTGWFLGEWHSFVFGFFSVIPWIIGCLFQTKVNKELFYKKIPILILTILPSFIVLLRLGLSVIEASNNFRSVRSIHDVAATNFQTSNFLGLKYFVAPFVSIVSSYFPNRQNSLADLALNFQNNLGNYPDMLSIWVFWICIVVFPVLFIHFIFSKSKSKNNIGLILSLQFTLIICYLMLLGPYLKIGDRIYENYKLIHYYVYQAFYPLQAIRAIWRIAIVGYLAFLMLAGLTLSKVYYHFTIFYKPISRIFVNIVLFVLFCGVLLIQNGGFTSPVYTLGTSENLDLKNYLVEFQKTTKKPVAEVFIWPGSQNNILDYQYWFSKWNLENKTRFVNIINPETVGAVTSDFVYTREIFNTGVGLEVIEEILRAKNVDLIIVSKDISNSENNKKHIGYEKNFKYYKLKNEDTNFKYFVQNKDVEIKTVQGFESLNYFLTASSTFRPKDTLSLYINWENQNEYIWIDPNPVKAQKFEIIIRQKDKILVNKVLNFGLNAFLEKGLGNSSLVKMSYDNLEPGVATKIELSLNNNKVYTKDVTVLNNDKYLELAKKYENQKVDISDENMKFNTGLNFGYTPSFRKVKFEILNGAILNNISNSKHKELQTQLIGTDGKIIELPSHSKQIDCDLGGNYFVGDKIEMWCNQIGPLNSEQDFHYKPIII